MSRFKVFMCVFGALTAFLIGYGAATKAYPAGGVHGRGEHNGYRTNINDTFGTYVLPKEHQGNTEAMPNTINSAAEYISFIKGKLGSGQSNQERAGASFIIETMIGANKSSRDLPPSAAQIAEWERRINYSASKGWITWRTNYSFTINSFYQGAHSGSNPVDDAFYDERDTMPAILFRNASGTIVYAIKWECANPVGTGNLGPIPDDVSNFSTSADIISSVNGGAGGATVAEAGDSIRFTYTVRNNGPAPATPVACGTWKHDYTGYKTPPAWIEAGATPNPVAMGCPATMADDATRQVQETITATANTTICRFLQVTPANQTGTGNDRDVACVVVYSKPYFKVYGGDVESGASFTPCGTALPANYGTIQGWNRGAAQNYAGSGTEGAAMAYREITEFVSASMRAVAPRTPIGLSFANNNAAADPWGGNYGAGSCVPDYWSLSTSTGATIINPGAGSHTVGGASLGAGAKQDIFVDGDAVITGNVVYTGNWTLGIGTNTIPSFRLIVRGNIYVRDTVTQLDGVYVALPRPDGSKGLIYTCALGGGAPTAVQVAFGCKQQLRVNGAFIAKGVKLLRTPNSLNNAVANEPAATSRAGEIFTYVPEVWLATPQFRFPSTSDYDAITTLPPVL